MPGRGVLSKMKGGHVSSVLERGINTYQLLAESVLVMDLYCHQSMYVTDQPKECMSEELSNAMLNTPNCVCEVFINFILTNENPTKLGKANLSNSLKIAIESPHKKLKHRMDIQNLYFFYINQPFICVTCRISLKFLIM